MAKTDKGNTRLEEVWITHYDSGYGPYLMGVSENPWGKGYDAPITKYADNTRFVNADRIDELTLEVNLQTERLKIALERAEAAEDRAEALRRDLDQARDLMRGTARNMLKALEERNNG